MLPLPTLIFHNENPGGGNVDVGIKKKKQLIWIISIVFNQVLAEGIRFLSLLTTPTPTHVTDVWGDIRNRAVSLRNRYTLFPWIKWFSGELFNTQSFSIVQIIKLQSILPLVSAVVTNDVYRRPLLNWVGDQG